MPSKRKKRKKIKFRTVTFKLSARQMKSLENFCKRRGTTPVKLIKSYIHPFITQFENINPETILNPKQLTIFDLIEADSEPVAKTH